MELERSTAHNRHIFKTLSSSHGTPPPQELPLDPRGELLEAMFISWNPVPDPYLIDQEQTSVPNRANQELSHPQQFLLLKLAWFCFSYLEPKGSKSYILGIYFMLPYTKLFALQGQRFFSILIPVLSQVPTTVLRNVC